MAATDSDVFHPDAFVGSTHVTQRERDALGRLLDAGLVDVDVARWGLSSSPLHVVETRHRLLAQSGHAPRHHRHRPHT